MLLYFVRTCSRQPPNALHLNQSLPICYSLRVVKFKSWRDDDYWPFFTTIFILVAHSFMTVVVGCSESKLLSPVLSFASTKEGRRVATHYQ
jgi:hypothetical protein